MNEQADWMKGWMNWLILWMVNIVNGSDER